jgi:hypothetical protein
MSSTDVIASRGKQLTAPLVMTSVLLALLLLMAASPTYTEAAPSTTNPSVSNPGPNKGVIKPPPTGDAGIQTTVPNPNAGSDKDVIAPPGTPKGDPNVEPR